MPAIRSQSSNPSRPCGQPSRVHTSPPGRPPPPPPPRRDPPPPPRPRPPCCCPCAKEDPRPPPRQLGSVQQRRPPSLFRLLHLGRLVRQPAQRGDNRRVVLGRQL